MEHFKEALNRYADFTGRIRRQSYWMFILFYLLFAMLCGLIDSLLGEEIISSIYALALFIPSLSATTRRLHDTGRSGWWQLLYLLPVVGVLIVIVFCVLDSEKENNQYGPCPK
ncbi:DUF805 domain-containing protein [Pseudoalteromonas sp.]|uniref:DUF805 domain-containing protein n=1 Tax=Pseudoalteromonas sp. TaxID=53249 RepID=UPI00272D27A4|nr:DUF805 domain-containing protein [Pseudoalteromonas sp.]